MTDTNQEVRNRIEEIKSCIDVRQYAVDRFGMQIGADDKSLCFMHSDKHPSLHFYSNGYHCFSCKGSGDAISLFQYFHPDLHFYDAVDDCSQYVGMPLIQRAGMSDEDRDRYRVELTEKQNLYRIYEEVTNYYASVLDTHEFAKDYARNQWGLKEEFWKTKKLGYALPGKTAMITHMVARGFSTNDLVMAGLALRAKEGTVSDFLRGRIVFPYWVGGKIVYMIGRRTAETPKIPQENKITGETEWVESKQKYKKLPVGKEEEEGYPVSPYVQNSLYGIDALRDRRVQEIVITEGVADAMMAEQNGIQVVSPVTTRMKESDFNSYIKFFQQKSKIYIINDNEANGAGESGALDIAEMLENAGCRVYIGVIPRPPGVEKIDLADLLHNSQQPLADFELVKKNARIPLVHRILSIDKGSDPIERSDQIMANRSAWGRIQPAVLPGIMAIIQDHFEIDAKSRDAMELSIKRVIREEEKKLKLANDQKASDAATAASVSLSLRDRVALELEASDSGVEITCDRIKNWIIEWLSTNGAKFFMWKEHEVGLIYFQRKLYVDGTVYYHAMMDKIACLNIKSRNHQLILQYISSYLIQEGRQITDFKWISTTDSSVKYLNLTGDEDDNLICMDPKDPEIKLIPNANNEHGVILRSPYFLKQIKYDPNVNIQEAMGLYKDLIFDNLACDTRDRYLIMGWSMLSLLLDELETRPILQCTGSAASGKTTAAKFLSTLLFGEQRHESDSTMAATHDLSNNVPCLYLDNKEQRNVADSLMEFLIASATKATRNKKGSLNAGDIVQQSPNCMVLLTSIEYFARKELIERILVVGFDEKFQRDSFSEGRIMRLIRANRDKIMSAFLKISHKVNIRLHDEEFYDLIESQIRSDNPVNHKKRNMDALIYLTGFMHEICKYIHQDFAEVKFGITNSASVHYDVIKQIIDDQNKMHSENTQDSSKINYFLNSLERLWDNKKIEPDGNGWDIGDDGKIKDFTERYMVEFRLHEGIKYLLTSYNDLHYAFSHISVPSSPYEITSPTNLRARIKDGYKVMLESGWAVGLNARRTNSDRLQVFVRFKDESDLTKLSNKYPDLRWLHLEKLRVA